jgi:AraC-like DNA-binding protein
MPRVVDYRCEATPHDRPFREQHERYCIALVRLGNFCYDTQGRTEALVAGSLLLGNAGDEYCCSHEYGVGDECTAFEYDAADLDELASACGWSGWRQRFPRTTLPPMPAVQATHRLAGDMLWSDRLLADEVAAAVAAHVMRALSHADGAAHAVRRADRDRVVESVEFLRQCSDDDVDLQTLADAAGLSRYHYLRTFRAVLGMTPHQFLIRLRLDQAMQWLRESARPVTDIAYACGFGDLSNFVKTFSRHVGCPPQQFRRRNFCQAGPGHHAVRLTHEHTHLPSRPSVGKPPGVSREASRRGHSGRALRLDQERAG